MTIITRFAPSPTGYLHIGGARTALFNYLFAKAQGGKFLLRIEDTDKERSTQNAIDAIINGLKWLGIDHDGEVVFQSKRASHHASAALSLIENGKAYYCFTPQSEIDSQRQHAIDNKQHFIFKSPWREVNSTSQYPANIKPVVRLKAPKDGITIIEDKLQGRVTVANDHLDDMVLLRSDGSPTYMLAVVVDDHEMGITHIIRGDDHLTNAARQILLYKALGWQVPTMVHIPLIHGSDGAKLSKRHGALGVEAYREMGYLPEATCNYLLRLGWSHGDDEIITREKAIEWFNLESLSKAPSKLDFAKMKYLNAQYLKQMDNNVLVELVIKYHAKTGKQLSDQSLKSIHRGMDSIKLRSELIGDLVKLSEIFEINENITYSDEALAIIAKCEKQLISQVVDVLSKLKEISKEAIEFSLKDLASVNNIKIGELMMPLRALITGMTASPSIFEIIAIIGITETVKRLNRVFE